MVSVDVFGHTLMSDAIGRLGPSGIGFKLTMDGQYDMENRRLCNVAKSLNWNDAASVESVHHIVQKAVKSENSKTQFLIQDNTTKIQALNSKVDNISNYSESHQKALQELITKNALMISALDTQLTTLNQRIAQLKDESQG